MAAKRARQINSYHHQLGEGIGLRGSAPAAGRVALEELPDHGHGGDLPGQDQYEYRVGAILASRQGGCSELQRSRESARPARDRKPWPGPGAAATAGVRSLSRHRHNVRVARILVGVTGGIAAYKACELVRLLVARGHDVTPVADARSGAVRHRRDVLRARAQGADGRSVPAPRDADLLVVAPLTAHTLARLAHGLADDLVTETALAHRGPGRSSRPR